MYIEVVLQLKLFLKHILCKRFRLYFIYSDKLKIKNARNRVYIGCLYRRKVKIADSE